MKEDNYEDIINLPHHVSKHRNPMPMNMRAAQFAPFAALVGHSDAIQKETMRFASQFNQPKNRDESQEVFYDDEDKQDY